MLFFELIQVALGARSCLSHPPSDEKWNIVYDCSEKQSLVGVLFSAIEKLPKERLPNMDLLMGWLGQAEYIKSQNELLNKRCKEVIGVFAEGGLRACVIKGQGVGTLYGDMSMLRTSGDIDLWVNGSWNDVMDFVNSKTPNREFDDKHTHLNIL